jgi:diguanylate cyclase (GGDEF)-like protein/PAS domain S-box-containing protein
MDVITREARRSEILLALGGAVALGCADLSVSLWLHDPDGEWRLAAQQPGDSALVPFCSTPIRSRRGALIGALQASAPRDARRARTDRRAAVALMEATARVALVALAEADLPHDDGDHRAVVERIPVIVYVAEAGPSGRWHYVSPQTTAILGYTPSECLADHDLWCKLLHPDDRAWVLAEDADAVAGIGPSQASEYRMCHRDGRTVWIRDDAVLVADASGRLCWHGVMSDITEQKRAELELERRAAQQAAVARLGEHALEGATPARLMNEAVSEAARILEMQLGAVFEFQAELGSLLLRAGVGWPEGSVDCTRIPAKGGSHAGYTLMHGRPVTVSDWNREDRFTQTRVLSDSGMRSGLCVVIEGRDGAWGILGLQAGVARAYSAADVDFVQALANVLADALQRRSAEDDIRHQALHDPLTGLPNRVLFLDRLEHALAQRKGQLAVLFLDLDHFKVVNDSLGHAAGDALLAAVAPRLSDAVRPGDTVARFGGDEFGVLLEGVTSESGAAMIAERIAASFARPFILEGSEHFVSASVGIAMAGDRAIPDALIRNADAAMYRAKDRGRARYELFDEDMRARAIARLTVESELRRALEHDELRVAYQPVVSLRDGSIVSVEALVRWEHPLRGLVPPGEFIPVAEEVGLIEPIGQWVLGEACRQTAEWHEARPDSAPIGISVNLSARQVATRELPQIVADVLRRSGIQPLSLSLEITESVLLDEADVVADTLSALRALGVRLILDDFGTGYSSLGYLTRLRVDGLKVDRSFVDGLGEEVGDTAIVGAIVGMAQALEIEVTAEGVETAEQLEHLRILGCTFAQGYHLARPLWAADVTQLLSSVPWWLARDLWRASQA